MDSLSDEEKARLTEQELFRLDLRKTLEPPSPRGWSAFLTADTIKWIVATLILPLSIGIWGYYDRAKNADALRNEQDIAARRDDLKQILPLAAGLTSGDLTKIQESARMLTYLADSPGASSALKDLVAKIIRDARTQIKGGNATARSQGAAVNAGVIQARNPGIAPAPPPSRKDLESAPTVSVKNPPPVSAVKSTDFVFIQIYDENQRGIATSLTDALQRDGVTVLGTENVVATHGVGVLRVAQKGSIDVRYYHPEDKAAATSLVPIIKKMAPQYGEPTVKNLVNRGNLAKLGTIEIWFPCGPANQTCS